MKIEGLRGMITGAASGLGRCFALELARAGARIVAGDVDEDGLRVLEQDAKGLPGQLLIAPLDVAQEASVKGFVVAAAQRLASINFLVNNAGVLRDGLLAAREAGWVRKLPTAQWKAVLDTNLTGAYFMAREVAGLMLEQQISPGLLVNISSVTRAGNPGQSNYAASKAGLDALTRTWALELAPHGIRVGGIAPGVINTPILGNLDAAHQQELFAKVPLGRIGQPVEIWLALKFIIDCDYFTGRVIEVDGGASF